MAFKIKISYGASNEKTIAAGEFSAETYTDIAESVKLALEAAYSTPELEDIKSFSVTVDAEFFEEDDEE